MDTNAPIALRLELEPDGGPLRGTVLREGHEPTTFHGMLQLMELLERIHALPRA